MAEFAKYYVEFLWQFVQNCWYFIRTIALTIYKFFITDVIDYFVAIGVAVPSFDVLGWIMLILSLLINGGLAFFIIFRLIQLIRRYVIYRGKNVDKDKLLEEIARLRKMADDLVDEKKKIFALKVGSDLSTNLSAFEGAPQSGEISGDLVPVAAVGSTAANVDKSRFTKLATLDDMYERNPNYIYMEYSEMIPLSAIVDNFVNFAASQLKLYYKPHVIREFFSGLATSKIIILEGISGTGKTSLPYAVAKYFNNNATIVSVQPSWRDRSELMGYFNEFTKRFNETDFLASVYEATLREDPNFVVLDEMNLARIEYYFADFLSIMEMPDAAEWKIDLVPNTLPTDPKNINYGKLLVPQNVWFVGTANNDDSTFTITDKVYDRAVALELNEKAGYFDAPMTESFNCSYNYLEMLFEKAVAENKISEANLNAIMELDDFIQQKFKVGFGNRVLKQMKTFIPNYIACGGTEMEAIDFMICSKILRKFSSLNLPFLTKELSELTAFMDRKFGRSSLKNCIEFIKQLQRNN